MAYDVSEKYRTIARSGGAEYDCILKVAETPVLADQIKSIDISSPIIDTTSQTGKVFHLGTFISEQIKIKFKNLDGLDFSVLPEVTLEIGMKVDDKYEYVPMPTFITDELAENYQKKCEITCLDYAVKFKKEVDISQWFNKEGYILAEDLLKKLCNYYGVALGEYPNVNLDKKITFYDSTLSGKTYISYLAELMGGNAKIGKDNKLHIKSIYEENNGIRKAIQVDVSTAKSLVVGDKYKLSRLVYDNGTNIYQFGGNVVEVEELPTTGIDVNNYYYLTSDMKYYKYNQKTNQFEETDKIKQTLNLRPENFFITQENEVENIYNAIKRFEVYNIECENRADLSLEAFDTLALTTGDEEIQSLKLSGNMEQETTKGKNLLKNIIKTQTLNGLTFTVNDDGTVVVNGTSTANTQVRVLENFELKDGEKYILNGCPTGGTGTTYSLVCNQYYNGASHFSEDFGTGVNLTYNILSKNSNSIYIRIVNGVTVNNLLFKPMLRLATVTDGTYEKYTGGVASPNPNYPQEIKTVEGYNKLGSNLKTITLNGLTLSIDDEGVYTLNGTNTGKGFAINLQTDFSKIEIGKTYTATLEILSGSFTEYRDNTNWAIILYILGRNTQITIEKNKNKFTRTIKDVSSVNDSYLWVGWDDKSVQGKNSVFNNFKFRIQIVEKTTEQPYLPYQTIAVKMQNKNLANYNTSSTVPNFDVGDVEKGKTYTISIMWNVLSSCNLKINSTTIKTIWDYTGAWKYTFTATESGILKINGFKGPTYDCTNILLEEGSNATDYVEHQEQLYPITIGDRLLTEGNYFYKENEKWKFYQAIKRAKLFINSGDWARTNANDTFTQFQSYINVHGAKKGSSFISNKFTNISISERYTKTGIVSYSEDNAIRISFLNKDYNILELATFISWFNSQGDILVDYELETPIIEEITDEVLVEQLENLTEGLKNKELNNISFLVENVKPNLEEIYGLVTYYTLNDHTVKFNGVAMDKLKTAIPSGNKTQTTNKYNRTKDTESFYLRTMIDEGEATIKTIANKQTKYQQQITNHEQRIDGLEQTAQQVENLRREATGTKKITITDCVVGNLLYLNIKGNNQVFKPLYPSNTLYSNNTLYPQGDSRLTITSKKGEVREYDLGVLDTLRFNGSKYDEYICENNQSKVIRRINADGSIRVNELIEDLGTIYIELFEDENTIEIKNYSADMYIQYAVKSNFSDVFTTKVEMNSAIKQTAQEISLEVKKNIDDNEKLSAIVLTPDGAKIKGESISLEGTVTANENFKILEDGSIEANNGTFKGDIFLGNGKKVIGGDGMLTNLVYSSVDMFAGYSRLGYNIKFSDSTKYYPSDLSIDVFIPKNFKVVSAYMTLFHSPAHWEGDDFNMETEQSNPYNVIGYARNLKLYSGQVNYDFDMSFSSEYYINMSAYNLDELKNAFDKDNATYTPPARNLGELDIIKSIDFSKSLIEGYQKLVVRSTDSVPNNIVTASEKTGMARAVVNVIGYYRFSDEENENEN